MYSLRKVCCFCCSVAKSYPTFATPWNAAARLPYPSLSSRVGTNSCPLSQWCHPSISSSVSHFFSCPQSFPASGSFPISWFFASGGQSIGVSASVHPMNIQGWFPLGLTGWSPCCPRKSQESSPAPQFKSINCLVLSLFYGPTLISIHDYWKNHSFDYRDLSRHLCFLICYLSLSWLFFWGASIF